MNAQEKKIASKLLGHTDKLLKTNNHSVSRVKEYVDAYCTFVGAVACRTETEARIKTYNRK